MTGTSGQQAITFISWTMHISKDSKGASTKPLCERQSGQRCGWTYPLIEASHSKNPLASIGQHSISVLSISIARYYLWCVADAGLSPCAGVRGPSLHNDCSRVLELRHDFEDIPCNQDQGWPGSARKTISICIKGQRQLTICSCVRPCIAKHMAHE